MSAEARANLVAFKSLRAFSGVDITLSRGVNSGTVKAVPGDTKVDVETEDGHVVEMHVRDYMILRDDFESIIGAGEEPERGDSFVEVVADYSRTFEAIELGDEVSRWWDKGGQVLRIHTVEVLKETTTTTTAGA